MCAFLTFVFFFKQKTAYEMRISDWSSDVCSSDLKLCFRLRIWSTSLIAQHLYGIGTRRLPRRIERGEEGKHHGHDDDRDDFDRIGLGRKLRQITDRQIGRASCRERVCPYV